MDTSPLWNQLRGRRIFWGLVIFFALIWIHAFLPVRIGSRIPLLNWFMMMLVVSSFPIILVSTLLLPESRGLWFMRLLLSMVSALSLLPILGLLFWEGSPTFTHTDQDPSFERIHEVIVQDYAIRAYRTNGGAATDYGIVVRRESTNPGSFYLFKNLYSAYHQSEVDVSPTRDGRYVIIRGNVLGRDTIAVTPL
jgi:hypothetical protein